MDNFQDVFISYGRADSKELAIKLRQQLSSKNLKVWLDIDNIPLGVDYQRQIDRDLESADNFLFIISPYSVNSPYCTLEIEHALRCNKRIIPLLHVETIDRDTWQQRYPKGTSADWIAFMAAGKQTSFANMHPAIRKINWVYCREGVDDFEQAMDGLLELIARDRNYVRQHTQWLQKALAWQRHQKQTDFLLIGPARQQAETWLKTQFKNQQAPCLPTDLQCELITESLKNADNLMTQVFLAYAEEDKAVMEQTQRFLRRQGITVWTNTTSIQASSDFSQAIDGGIAEADNLVYLLSPDALNSPWCQHELDYALELNKRIIPIQVRATTGLTLPPGLESLQHIDLTSETSGQTLALEDTEFLKILRQDEGYHREHKRLLTKALKWQRQNRNPCILLRGYNLRRSEAWLKVADKQHQFPPTPLQIEFITESLQQPTETSLEVFISYSRINSEFARQLNDALQIQGKTTWFDQESIASGADFQQEIFSGIENADNFLFLISPSSVNSPYCEKEVNYAASLNKRIVTVLCQPVEPDSLPGALKTLQWIDFKNHQGDFYANFSELVRTLETDREHVHQHTRWYQRAMDWEQKGKSQDVLLRGSEFAIANDWLQTAQQQQKKPPPMALQQAFIQTSEASIKAAAEREKRLQVVLRSLLGLMTVAFLTATGLGIWAFFSWRRSEIAQLEAMTKTSRALFLADQKPDALSNALKAGHRLSSIPNADRAPVLSALQQIVYGIRELRQINGHGDQVNSIAFSPDGQQFATASDDNIVKVWTRDGNLIQALTDHKDRVNQVIFSPDGQQFATASADGTVKLWAKDGLLMETLQGHRGEVKSVAFNPGTTTIHQAAPTLATADADGSIYLWNHNGKIIKIFQAHQAPINRVVFSPDGLGDNDGTIVTGSDDGTVKRWTLEGTLLQTLTGHRDDVKDIALSPNGEYIATVSDDKVTKLWNRNGQELQSLIGHSGPVNGVAFSLDSTMIATASDDRTVRLWNLKGENLETLSGHLTGIQDVTFATDGQMIATASSDNTVKLWELTGEQLPRLKGHTDWVVSVAFSPDGQTLATASGDRMVNLWSRQGKKLLSFSGHGDWVNSVAFSPDGRTLATASNDKTAKLWNLAGKELATLRGHHDHVSSVAFSPDGQTIATASADKTIKLWNLQGEEFHTILGHNDWVRSVTFSPEGETIASSDAENIVKLWHRDGTLLKTLLGHDDWVRDVTFSPDGQLLATASADNTVKLWHRDGDILQTLKGHDYWVLGVAFSPDGQTIATASADNTVKLWTHDGQALQTLHGHKNWVVDIAFGPDGKTLASASGDKTVILWNLADFTLAPLMTKGCRWIANYELDSQDTEMTRVSDFCQQNKPD